MIYNDFVDPCGFENSVSLVRVLAINYLGKLGWLTFRGLRTFLWSFILLAWQLPRSLYI
jgi:hypothetical protein